MAWFSAADEPALRDLWSVYDANFETMLEALLRGAPTREATASARERIRLALAGGWTEYEAQLRQEAIGYARRGLSFATWHGLVSAAFAHITPFIVRAFAGDVDRQSRVLVAMYRFGGRAIEVLGESFLSEREIISREKELESERKQRRAERRYARLVESGLIGVIVATLDAKIIEINDAALAMVGRTREEILSGAVRWSDLTPDEWRARDDRVRAELRATGLGALREKEYLHRDGHRVPVLLGSAMIEGTDGESISFVLDLTERKRAEAAVVHLEAVRAGEALALSLVDSVIDYAIYMLDATGHVLTWNRGAERLKGYTRDEIVGKHFSAFYTPAELANDAPGKDLAVAIAEGRSVRDGWRVRRDGSRFWAEVVVSATKDAAGNVLGFAKVTRDLTARRATEKALSDANRELEAFSYSVAHDLRAPLRGMSGFARVLLDHYGGKLDAEGKDWLEEILLTPGR